MNSRDLVAAFWAWIDCVAATVGDSLGRVRSVQRVRLVEEDPDQFRFELPAGKTSGSAHLVNGPFSVALPDFVTRAVRGSQVEVVLQARRFLFQPLDLPKRATEFLAGIVRSQLDRLTPWNAEEAAFGWAPAAGNGEDRVMVTVAATPRAAVEPFLRVLSDFGAQSILVSTVEPAASTRIEVLRHKVIAPTRGMNIRKVLAGVLASAASLAFFAFIANQILGSIYDAQRDEALARANDARHIVSQVRVGGAQTDERLLELRKQKTPSTVIVLDELSRVLPDHTFATELRVEGDKLQIIGITHDAPSLIRLIEQSSQFTRATFFAPTTRSPTDPGERFHIEARITPRFGVRQ